RFQARFELMGRPAGPASGGITGMNLVSSAYFEVFKIPVLRGRTFTERNRTGPPAVIINQTLAIRFWPDDDPLQNQIMVGGQSRQIGIATARILAGVTRVARPSTLYRRQKHQFSYSSHKIVLPSLRSASSDLILPAPCKAYQVRSSDTCTHHQQSPSCRRSAVPLRSLFPIGRRRRS